MNSDFRISVGFWQHPKTKKTVRRIGLEGVRSLQILWAWAAVNRSDGNLSGMDWEDIELAADWQGEERKFFESCLGVWIDETEEGCSLHDWQDHNPWVAEADVRSDAARLSRFSRKHPELAKIMREDGIKGLTQEEYRTYDEGTSYVRRTNDEGTTDNDRRYDEGTTYNDRSTVRTTPSPSPSPTLRKEENTPIGVFVGAGSPTPAETDEQVEPERQENREETGAQNVPACPHQRIIALYHEKLPELAAVKVWTATRKKHLQARWRERWQSGKYKTLDDGILYWERLFTHIRADCDWLMGRVPVKDGRAFMASLDWLIKPQNFAKIIEGNYDRREQDGNANA